MRVLGVIPARLGSTRLPNKPLQLLAGEPLITRVIQRVLEHGLTDDLVVATDSPHDRPGGRAAGVRAVLTDPGHPSGTDRVAEVAARPEFAGSRSSPTCRATSPSWRREALAGALARVEQGDDIGTAAAPLDPALAGDPARVKVVTDAAGRALYFSRAPIPFRRDAARARRRALSAAHRDLRLHPRGAGPLGGGAAQPGRAGRAAGAAPRAAPWSQHRRRAALTEAALPGIDTGDDLRRAEAHWHAFQG